MLWCGGVLRAEARVTITLKTLHVHALPLDPGQARETETLACSRAPSAQSPCRCLRAALSYPICRRTCHQSPASQFFFLALGVLRCVCWAGVLRRVALIKRVQAAERF